MGRNDKELEAWQQSSKGMGMVDTEKMIQAKEAYDRWYVIACRLALKLGDEGTTISGKGPDANGVYPDPVITLPSGLSFTVGRPPRKER